MNERLLPLYFIFAFVAIILGIIFICILAKKYEENRILKLRNEVLYTSEKYKKLKEITERFNFHKDIRQTYYYSINVNSKPKFDRFNYDLFFKENIYNQLNMIDKLIPKVKYNKEKYYEYQNIFNSIYSSDSDSDNKDFIYMEKTMLLECRNAVVVSPDFICSVSYTSPQGRNSYSSQKIYNFEDLIRLRDEVVKEKEEQKTDEYIKRTERRKMSDSLRYDVMKRDDFKCVLCGRSAKKDGVSLEIDHIKPISKGGKTTISNLQTLCRECNRGKRDKYNEDNME